MKPSPNVKLLTPQSNDRESGSTTSPLGSLCNQLHEIAAARVAFYLGASRASATHRAYAADLVAFRAWGGTIPGSPEMVAAYLATSAALATSTLRRRLAAITDAHLSAGFPDPTKHVLVRKVLRGICRTHGVVGCGAVPLDIAKLTRIVEQMSDDLAGLRDRALLLVGFFAALRRTELVGLDVRDVILESSDCAITVRRSKTDQVGSGHVVRLPNLQSSLCPATALQCWLKATGITDGAVFRSINIKGQLLLSRQPAQDVGRVLRLRALEAQVGSKGLSAHSLRSGFVVSAVRAGVALPLIQAVTRHTTLAGLEPYVRAAGPPSTQQFDAIRHLGGGKGIAI